jgi:hypothetical protein
MINMIFPCLDLNFDFQIIVEKRMEEKIYLFFHPVLRRLKFLMVGQLFFLKDYINIIFLLGFLLEPMQTRFFDISFWSSK